MRWAVSILIFHESTDVLLSTFVFLNALLPPFRLVLLMYGRPTSVFFVALLLRLLGLRIKCMSSYHTTLAPHPHTWPHAFLAFSHHIWTSSHGIPCKLKHTCPTDNEHLHLHVSQSALEDIYFHLHCLTFVTLAAGERVHLFFLLPIIALNITDIILIIVLRLLSYKNQRYRREGNVFVSFTSPSWGQHTAWLRETPSLLIIWI